MTAADQPPDEIVEMMAKIIGHYTDGQWERWHYTTKGQYAERKARQILAAFWPLVQERERRAVRDAKIETLDRAITIAGADSVQAIRASLNNARREVALEIQSLCREVQP
jgi:hypothetical protein